MAAADGRHRRSRRRSATRWSCASRSAWSARSRRGTTRCTRSRPRSRPALAAGCTVVLKPREVAPLNAFMLAEVHRRGRAARRRLQPRHRHRPGRGRGASPPTPASTWSRSPARPRAGRRVAEVAARTVKRVALELGGKSPNVILDDADLEAAVTDGVAQVLPQLGPDVQRADAHARPARRGWPRPSRSPPRRPTHFTPGDPVRPGDAGSGRSSPRPSASACAATSARASQEGAKLVTGGAEPPEGLERGYFVRPTVFSDVTHRHDDRPGGDLRAGAVDHALRRRGGRGRGSPTTPSTAWPAACGPATPSAPSAWPAASAPARSRSTAAPSTRWRRSAATSSPGTGASSGSFGLEEFLEIKSMQL